jgi:DnaJ-domain-containing protein 1
VGQTASLPTLGRPEATINHTNNFPKNPCPHADLLRESHGMSDHFAVLDQPRRPWLDAEALKECFHRASAAYHPDVVGSGDAAQFAAANAAYSALRDTVWRLRHLLELEAPEQLARAQAIPPEISELFPRVAELRAALDGFQKKESAAPSALARALLADERLAMWNSVIAVGEELKAAHEAALADLQALDAEWEPRATDASERLAVLHQRFAYLSKWRAQLGESLFKFQS